VSHDDSAHANDQVGKPTDARVAPGQNPRTLDDLLAILGVSSPAELPRQARRKLVYNWRKVAAGLNAPGTTVDRRHGLIVAPRSNRRGAK